MVIKKLILSATLVALFSSAFAQEEQIYKSIENSKEYIKNKDYRSAAGSLQEAINRINDIIGAQILAGLPKTSVGFNADMQGDQVTSLGTMMGAGMVITRNYVDEKGRIMSIQITPNSPSLESLNTFLDNPDTYGKDNDAGKSMKIGKFKALFRFTKGENDESSNGYLQMPFYTSVLVFQGSNFKTEEDFTNMVQSINFDNLAKAMGYVKEGEK
ncbi:MAG: hypothetical protein ABI723_03140 [Bacteroidia bacterium]